jgi:ribonuclease VapC
MTSVVLDASAVLALVRDERGADKVAPHIGRAVISAVDLQEVIKELLICGLDEVTIREVLGELRLDVRAHDADAAYAAAVLYAQTHQYCRELGGRSCLALAAQLGVPALTADPELKNVKVKNLRLEHIR